ncbi:hypothetical protein FRC11_003487 [Ceratobasidium sp. 423]|nr:hypothetical protein FRC11_003487 [Ceratobasidium sp. 423]
MPATTLRRVKVEYLNTEVPTWRILKGKWTTGPDGRSQLQAQTTHIRNVCKIFLQKFPERDPTVSDPTPITFTQDELEDFPRRVQQWFGNNTRSPVMQDTKEKASTKKRTHARNLASQRYHQEINEIAHKIRQEQPELQQLAAFNKATMQFMLELKEQDPDRYEKLSIDAEQIQSSGSKDYTELNPEVVTKLLQDFPMELLSELEEHGRTLPIHIWCIATYATPPDQDVKGYA